MVSKRFPGFFSPIPPTHQDDILDEADTRRGEEAAHVRLGERAAALVGDFLWLGHKKAAYDMRGGWGCFMGG